MAKSVFFHSMFGYWEGKGEIVYELNGLNKTESTLPPPQKQMDYELNVLTNSTKTNEAPEDYGSIFNSIVTAI